VTFRKGKAVAAYLYLPRLSGARVERTVEARPGIMVDYAATGEPIGLELVNLGQVTIATVTEVLGEIGVTSVGSEDLAPLQAA
jgi:hypothetical protein